ncbi:hypothetical protein GCM10010417_14290 [Streptomyces carpaticus]
MTPTLPPQARPPNSPGRAQRFGTNRPERPGMPYSFSPAPVAFRHRPSPPGSHLRRAGGHQARAIRVRAPSVDVGPPPTCGDGGRTAVTGRTHPGRSPTREPPTRSHPADTAPAAATPYNGTVSGAPSRAASAV